MNQTYTYIANILKHDMICGTMDFALQKFDSIGSLHYQGPNNLPFQCYHSKLINIQFCKNVINMMNFL